MIWLLSDRETDGLVYQCHDPHALHVAGRAARGEFGGGVSAGRGGGGEGGCGGRGSDGGSGMVHACQVQPLQAHAGHAVLDFLCPQFCWLLLFLDQPGEKGEKSLARSELEITVYDNELIAFSLIYNITGVLSLLGENVWQQD